VTATVFATPVEVTWDPGDGSDPVTCTGPGRGSAPEPGGEDATCAVVYAHRSTAGSAGADGTWPLTATVTWAVRWEATTGTGGVLEPVTRTTTVPVRVVEAQAVLR
jgi:hypothetical protein